MLAAVLAHIAASTTPRALPTTARAVRRLTTPTWEPVWVRAALLVICRPLVLSSTALAARLGATTVTTIVHHLPAIATAPLPAITTPIVANITAIMKPNIHEHFE